jgi:uncharacterized protein (DUF362 family)
MLRRDALRIPLAALAPEPAKSRVVLARDPKPDAARLVDRAVQSLYGRDSAIEAWKQVVKPGEVVGLKVNCLAGKGASTRPALVEAVCERLREAGIRAGDILIWDRLDADLESAGFRIQTAAGRVRTMGNDRIGYGNELLAVGSAGSLMSRAMSVCDAVINLPVLKDHGIVGVTMALKNLFGAVHNPNKYHMHAGNPYVADVYMLPPIRQKVRLHICDGTVAQYEGGPTFMPQWTWPFNGLLAATDPVALDYTGWRIIEKKRAEKGMPPLEKAERAPVYISTAADAEHRIGTCDPKRIEVVEA